MMGVSGKTVKRLIFRGELKGLKVGAQWRVRLVAIEDYLDRGEQLGGRS
jgi:excisionase family DNA binding protein